MIPPCIVDIARRIGGSCLEPIVGYIKTEVGYVWNYSTNLQNLRKEVENLNDSTEFMNDRITEASNGGETKVDPRVERWQTRVTSLVDEASKIIEDEERETERCLMGLRPNLWACYLASKSAKKVIDDVTAELQNQKTVSDRVAYIDNSQCLGVPPVPDFEEFDSRAAASAQILEFLKDPSVKRVGIYGLGGTGKTTLAAKVAAQLKREGIFNFVIMAVVSDQHKLLQKIYQPDLLNIQKQIAALLNIELQNKDNLLVRAEQLRKKLEEREKLLIVLDDIWSGFELEKLGIPAHSSGRQLKILMTSRNVNVLIKDMDSKYNVPLETLSADDAWKLFHRMTDGVTQDSDLHSIAQQVVNRCGGIPVILVTIARALRNEELETWKEVLTQLKRFDGEDLVEDGYKRIEVSYNFLKSDEIRSLFLLCAQMDPHSISIRDLLRYSMGLGLFKGREKLTEVSSRLSKNLSDLKGYCLLQDGNTEWGTLRMHDVVHQFAVSVSSRDHHVLTIADKLEKWPPKDQLEQLTAISLPYCHLPHDQLPAIPFDTPKLESFLMYRRGDDSTLEIPDRFFVLMTGLKVLDLRRISLSPVLPSSFDILVNLQTLCLDYCELDNIAMIGDLSTLQVLSLMGSTVAYLPKERGKLAQLKVLDLSGCSKLKVIASGVLSKLTSLEDLRIEDSYNNKWEKEVCSSEESEKASLGELRKLQNLINLHIEIINARLFPKDLVFGKLETFRILIGDSLSRDFKTSKSLKLMVDQMDEGTKALMERAEDLQLKKLEGFTSLCELDWECFPHLKHLSVENDVGIKHIVQQSSCVVLPKLESLTLSELQELERICGAQLPPRSLKNLSIIKVYRCDRLKDLFSSHLARGLLCLKELTVTRCESLETIVSGEDEEEIIEFPQLQALTLYELPRFRSFYSNLNPTVSAPNWTRQDQQFASNEIVEENELTTPAPLIFKQKIMLPKLEKLEIWWMEVEKIWDDQLAAQSFQNLTTLEIWLCQNLSYLFTSIMVKNFVQLKNLQINECNSIEEIITTKGKFAGEMILFPKLETLELGLLSNLKRFCQTNLIEYPSLKVLGIRGCPELKRFVTLDGSADLEAKSSTLFDEKIMLPILEELEIWYMEVEKIWDDQLAAQNFQNLTSLSVVGCQNLSYLFTSFIVKSFSQLKDLWISDCKSIKEIVATEEKLMGEMILFPKLELLKLEHLRNLKRFCQANLIVCPSLKELEINNCSLERFVTHDGIADIEAKALTLFNEKVVFPNLEELTLCRMKQLKMIWGNELHPNSFTKLKKVQVYGGRDLLSVFPASVAQNLQQFETLRIHNCERLQEIVSRKLEEVEEDRLPRFVFPNVNFVHLKNLRQLERFYPEPHISDWPKLKDFIVHACDKINTNDPHQQDATFAKIMLPNREVLELRSMTYVKRKWDDRLVAAKTGEELNLKLRRYGMINLKCLKVMKRKW